MRLFFYWGDDDEKATTAASAMRPVRLGNVDWNEAVLQYAEVCQVTLKGNPPFCRNMAGGGMFMGLVDTLKSLGNLVKEIGDIELNRKIIDLQQEVYRDICQGPDQLV